MRQRLHKRAFKALKEGWKQGFGERHSVAVEAKEITRPVVAAMDGEESVRDFVDRGIASGKVPTEKWGLEDGKRS